jgi:dTDP-4-amino-4,6-dideoxygalactose transaminase
MQCACGREGIETIEIQQNGEAGYLRFPVVVGTGRRTSFDSARARRLGIMPAYPKPLVDLSDFTDRCMTCVADFPGARLLSERLYTFPTHSKLSATDLQGIEILLRDGASASQ